MKNKFTLLVSFIVILLMISCKSKVRYSSGTTTDLTELIDSIEKTDMIIIPDTSEWKEIWYSSSLGTYKEKFINVKGPKETYELTISGDSIINYEYKVKKH